MANPEPLDDLERDAVARAHATQIHETTEPGRSIVFALTGPWGSGKSWLLDRLKSHLATEATNADRPTLIVDFNPWLFHSEEALLRGFTNMLLGRQGLKFWRRRFAASVFDLISGGSSISFGSGIPGISGSIDRVTKKLAERISPVGSPEAIRKALTKALKLRNRRLVVVLDDLDRLTPSELLTVFRLVRLVGNIPDLHYVLSYDQESVSQLLSRTDVATSTARAEQFLEKIVDRRLAVPPLTPAQLERLAIEPILAWATQVDDFDERDEASLRLRLQPIVYRVITTPRSADRFVGAVVALSPRSAAELYPEHWVLSALVRTFAPRAWELVVRERELLTGVSRGLRRREDELKQRASALQDLFEQSLDDSPYSGELLGVIQHLFPTYARIIEGRSGMWNQTLAEAEGHIGHPDFVERYLWPDTPPGQVSDVEVRRHLRSLPDSDATDALITLVTQKTLPTLSTIARNASDHRVSQPDLVRLLLRLEGPSDGQHPAHLLRAMLAQEVAAALGRCTAEELTGLSTDDLELLFEPPMRKALTDQRLLGFLPDGPLQKWVEAARATFREHLVSRLRESATPSYENQAARADLADLLNTDIEVGRSLVEQLLASGSWLCEDVASLYAIELEGPIVSGVNLEQLELDLGRDLMLTLVRGAEPPEREMGPGPVPVAQRSLPASVESLREVTRRALVLWARVDREKSQ